MKKLILIAVFVIALAAVSVAFRPDHSAKVAPNAGHVLAGGGPLDGPVPPPAHTPQIKKV